jgi:hypothetical protein
MIIPSGYGAVALPIVNTATPRAAYVTWGFQNVGALIGPIIAADAVMDALESTVSPALDSSCTIGPAEVRLNIGGVENVGSSTETQTGGSADQRPAPNCALLVQKRSGVSGRKNRGRFYWPWAINNASINEAGVISTGTVNDFQDIFDNFLENLSTEGIPMRILHNSAGTPAPVIGLSVSPLVATQRRRLRP